MAALLIARFYTEKSTEQTANILAITFNIGINSYSLSLKPGISSHSKHHMRLLKCFVLNTLCSKTKHLRRLI